MHEEKRPILLDEPARRRATMPQRGDGRGNDRGAGLGQLRRDEADALNIQVTVVAREAQLRAELRPDRLAEQQRHGAAGLLVQRDVERARDRVLAAVRVPRQEHREALPGARRVALPQHAHHLRVGEPFGNGGAGAQPRAEFRAGDVERAHPRRDLVPRPVLVRVRQVGHLLEGDHLDAELRTVLLHDVLRVVRPVEVLARRLGLAGPRVVPPDDEVRRPVVLADDGVPEGFARAPHAHGERQEAQHRHAVRVPREERLVDAHAREVVDVAGLGEADDRVDEDVGLAGARGADGELPVRPVHRVAGLEGHHARPPELVEVGAEFGGGVAQGDVVVVHEAVDRLELAPDVVFARGMHEVADGRVVRVAAEDVERFDVPVVGLVVGLCGYGL